MNCTTVTYLQVSFAGACASGLVAAQCYCLIYRFLAILDSRRYYEAFISKASFALFHAIGFAIAIVIGTVFYVCLRENSVKDSGCACNAKRVFDSELRDANLEIPGSC